MKTRNILFMAFTILTRKQVKIYYPDKEVNENADFCCLGKSQKQNKAVKKR